MNLKAKLKQLFSRDDEENPMPEMDTDERRVVRFEMIILWLGLGGFFL